jgi:hypothetical protein
MHLESTHMYHPFARSKSSNSLWVLPGVDGRSKAARRYRDVIAGALRDMGKAEDQLTRSEFETLRELGFHTVRLEDLQDRALRGSGFKMQDILLRVSGLILRLRWTLGIGPRRRQDFTPSELATFLAEAE